MNSRQKYNYGFAIIKIVCCFLILCGHFGVQGSCLYSFLQSCATPMFMLVSFVLTTKNDMSIKRRLKRLYFPFAFWGIFSYLIYLLLSKFGLATKPKEVNLISQLFLGIPINLTYWFIFALLICTLIVYVLTRVCRNNLQMLNVIALTVMGILFALQYWGILYDVISRLRWQDGLVAIVVGRTNTMMTYAMAGLVISKNSLIQKMGKRDCIFLGGTGLLALYAGISGIFSLSQQFGYEGIETFIVTLSICCIGGTIPFEKMHWYLKLLTEKLARYTMGIYYMHILIGTILVRIFERIHITIKPLLICIMIYITGYFVSDFICKKIRFLKIMVM